MAALLLARRGLTTLLIERRTFPRDKVCGGCLNARAIDALSNTGLNSLLNGSTAAPLDSVRWRSPRRAASIPVPGGTAILRSEFDDRLAQGAQAAGATVLTGISADVSAELFDDCRRIQLRGGDRSKWSVDARVVLACDGLGNSSLAALAEFRHRVHPRARVGAGGVLDHSDDAFDDLPRGVICMSLGAAGYVGRVRLGDGRVNVAAALDVRAVRSLGPVGVVNQILTACGRRELPSIAAASIRGTMPLMRRARTVAAGRVLLLGDASGYAEPFTGDGMALALETAIAAAPIAVAAQKGWSGQLARQWEGTVHRIAAPRRLACRTLVGLCRRPFTADLALSLMSRVPGAFASLASRMNRCSNILTDVHQWECT
jgi:flavin-dependent dehydrogenase